ncbi:ribonuclease P protein component [soil metagenome]
MLDRSHRLTTSAGFTHAVRTGRRAGTRTLVLHLGVRSTPEPVESAPAVAQVGFVVSKAVGNSVTRNLVKRRLRHLARERITSLPGSAVLVVRALPASALASYDLLAADLDKVLDRLAPVDAR